MTFLGLQGLFQSPSYEKLVGSCLMTRGLSTPQSCCLLPFPPSRIHSLIPALLGPIVVIGGREKRMSLFSLLIFSITKNYPRMSKDMCPSPIPSLFHQEWSRHNSTGVILHCPSILSSQTCRRGILLLAAAETPGYLDKQGFMRRGRRRYNSTASEGLFLQRAPCPGPQPSHSLLP